MADFTPTWTDWTDPGPFRFWAQKVLPLVYDDSLSYYEVLCKVVAYLNTTIQNVAAMGGNVEGLRDAYEQLQQYVNDYFTNLDVQQEINTKLDNMAETGALTTLIEPFVNSQISSDVAAWLELNIKPTTPAIDASLTVPGAAADAKATGLLVRPTPLSGGTDLDTVSTPGLYELQQNITYTNAPQRFGHRLLYVYNRNTGNNEYNTEYFQILFCLNGNNQIIYSRVKEGGIWRPWLSDQRAQLLELSKLDAVKTETPVTLNMESGYYINRFGLVIQTDTTSYRVSDAVTVTPGEVLHIQASAKFNYNFYSFFDALGSVIDTKTSELGGNVADVYNDFLMVPAGAATIRIFDTGSTPFINRVSYNQIDVKTAYAALTAFNPTLVSLGGGQFYARNMMLGEMASSNQQLFVRNRANSYTMPLYSALNTITPALPDAGIYAPLYLGGSDTVTVAAGLNVVLYKTTPTVENGAMLFKYAATITIDATEGAVTSTPGAGLYFIARVYKTDHAAITQDEAQQGVVITAGGVAAELDAIRADQTALQTDLDMLSPQAVLGLGGGTFKPRKLIAGQMAAMEGDLYIQTRGNCYAQPIWSARNTVHGIPDNSLYLPYYLEAGSVVTVAAGFTSILYRTMPAVVDGKMTYKWAATMSAPAGDTSITTSGYYFVGRVYKPEFTAITEAEAMGAVQITAAGVGPALGALTARVKKLEENPSYHALPKNPYKVAKAEFREVISTTHAHCVSNAELTALMSLYDHVAISNYYPSAPWYPLDAFYTETITPGFLASPNGEQAHFSDQAKGVHACSVGSFLSAPTEHYLGTFGDMVKAAVSQLQFPGAGGVTINHPKTGSLTAEAIAALMDANPGIFAMEIYNSNVQFNQGDNKGMAVDLWDGVLATGRQIYGTAVPDHEIQNHAASPRGGFGYCHVLVRAKTEQQILNAYANGRFYASIDNDGLTFTELKFVDGVFTVEVSESSTITFVTANGRTTSTGTSATYTPAANDVYVRVEATRGSNTLYSNAVML